VIGNEYYEELPGLAPHLYDLVLRGGEALMEEDENESPHRADDAQHPLFLLSGPLGPFESPPNR
jgi:hypothetical protein